MAASGVRERDHPEDHSFVPDPSSLTIIPAGEILVRVYDHVAASGRYSAATYNPKPVDDPSKRGRYSSTSDFEFDYLYLAEYKTGEQVAILETIDYKITSLKGLSGRYFLPHDKVANLSVAYFETVVDLSLVDFTTRPKARDLFHANQTVLEGDDQQLTRRWARWVEEEVTFADGIRYRSHQFGSDLAGYPIVLLDAHNTGLCTKIVPYGAEIRLGSMEGYQLLSDIAEDTNWLPEYPWGP